MSYIDVSTGCRLHFGLLCGAPNSVGRFGGIGMMIDSPGWKLRVACRDSDSSDAVSVSDELSWCEERVRGILDAYRSISSLTSWIEVSIESAIPQHAGLGSGTQLAIAIGTALHTLINRRRPESAISLAGQLQRRRRSAIGSIGFEHGGFIFDHGQSSLKPDAVTYDRVSFPEEWRIVLITPRSEVGISGQREEEVFRSYQSMDVQTVDSQILLVKEQILPAIRTANFDQFQNALELYGRVIGEFFASEQGGVFSSSQMTSVAEWLNTKGLAGAVQSSWGPTICVPVESENSAKLARDLIHSQYGADEFDVRLVAGLNCGARVSSPGPEMSAQVFRG